MRLVIALFAIAIMLPLLLVGCNAASPPSYTGHVSLTAEDEFGSLYLAVAQESTRCTCKEFQIERNYNPLGANITYVECPRMPQFPDVVETEIAPKQEYSSVIWESSEESCLYDTYELYPTYLRPALVSIANLPVGNASAIYPITIYNGGQATRFAISIEIPSQCNDGYTPAPQEAKTNNWIAIQNNHLLIPQGESQDVNISVRVPWGEQPPDKWEFWVVVEKESTGNKFPSIWHIAMEAGE